MRTLFLVLSLIVFSQTAFSQKLFFAKSNYTDSIAFENNIPALALQAIDKYREPDKATYYDNLFRLLLVAKE